MDKYKKLLDWCRIYGKDLLNSEDENEDDIGLSPEVFNLATRIMYVDRRGASDEVYKQFQIDKYCEQVYQKISKSLYKKIIELLDKKVGSSTTTDNIMVYLMKMRDISLYRSVLFDKIHKAIP